MGFDLVHGARYISIQYAIHELEFCTYKTGYEYNIKGEDKRVDTNITLGY